MKREAEGGVEQPPSPLTNPFLLTQAVLFRRHPVASLVCAIVVYAAVVLIFGPALGVSANYFVLLPILAAALGLGFAAGLAAGALALPANLLLFLAIGRLDFSPESKVIAEFSGIVIGLVTGVLADYFMKVEAEMRQRAGVEAELRKALDAKELLLRELNHRVRNNLNVVKSLIQLQQNRTKNPDFIEASTDLLGRIFAISLVHDQLSRSSGTMTVDPARYIGTLASNVVASLGLEAGAIDISIGDVEPTIPADTAVPLGLIVNETLTKALRHRVTDQREGRPPLALSFGESGTRYVLKISDGGGDGFAAGNAEAQPRPGSLGLQIVELLSKSLRGSADFPPLEGAGGVLFELSFPLPAQGEQAQD